MFRRTGPLGSFPGRQRWPRQLSGALTLSRTGNRRGGSLEFRVLVYKGKVISIWISLLTLISSRTLRGDPLFIPGESILYHSSIP